MTDSDSLVDTVTDIAVGDHAAIETADEGRFEAHVTDVDTDQDGLTGTATRTVTFESSDGCVLTVTTLFDAGPDTHELEYATIEEGDAMRHLAIERIEDSDQTTLVPDGGSELATHRPHRIACTRCDEPLTEWRATHRYGFWDAETQTYEQHGGIEDHYCRECWNDDLGRTNGAHYRPDSTEELFDVLDAADGNLAGVLTWWSGRPAVRVVDGDPEAAVTKPKHGGYSDEGTPILKFESERMADFDREEFDDVADVPADMNLVLLLDPERTAFGALDGGESDGQ